jgi:hypothetical protein
VTGLITDLPIWTDCPFRAPKEIEVRRGKPTDDKPEIIALWNPKTRKHVDFDADIVNSRTFNAAVNLLTGKGRR